MKKTAKRNLPGIRTYEEPHSRPKPPVTGMGKATASKCIRAGNPEFPVNRIYTDKPVNTVE